MTVLVLPYVYFLHEFLYNFYLIIHLIKNNLECFSYKSQAIGVPRFWCTSQLGYKLK